METSIPEVSEWKFPLQDAAVQHGADVAAGGAVRVGADPLVLQVYHGLDPDTRVGTLGARLDGTVLLGGEVQCVGVQPVLRVNVAVSSGGPGAVVEEVVVRQHPEHVVPPALQEGRPGALHLARVQVCELSDHLPDTDHLRLPLVRRHGLPVGEVVPVADGVGGHLVAEVPVLVDEAVVGGGLGQEVGGPDVAPVGVLVGPVEEAAIELLLGESSEAVIEGEVDDLRPRTEVGYDRLLPTAVTVGLLTEVLVAPRKKFVLSYSVLLQLRLRLTVTLLYCRGAVLSMCQGEERGQEGEAGQEGAPHGAAHCSVLTVSYSQFELILTCTFYL